MKLEPGTYSIFPCKMADGRDVYEQVVLAWLWKYRNSDSGVCFPSLATLAERCRISTSRLKIALNHLEQDGCVKRIRRRTHDGCPLPTIYEVFLAPKKDASPPPLAVIKPRGLAATKPLTRISKNLLPKKEEDTEASKDGMHLESFVKLWSERYRGMLSYGRIGKTVKQLLKTFDIVDLLASWKAYVGATEGRFASPERWASTIGDWMPKQQKQRVYTDTTKEWK